MLAQDGTRLPGDSRHRSRSKAEAEGITLDDALHGKLLAYADRRRMQ